MAYLDKIPLEKGETLPPRYRLVKAGPGGRKIAVVPGTFVQTYGRFDSRDGAIESAWSNFGWTPQEWDKVCVAVYEKFPEDTSLHNSLTPEAET